MTRSTDSRRARNSDSVMTGGRRGPDSRPSRLRCRFASSRVNPRTDLTSLDETGSSASAGAAPGRAPRCSAGRRRPAGRRRRPRSAAAAAPAAAAAGALGAVLPVLGGVIGIRLASAACRRRAPAVGPPAAPFLASPAWLRRPGHAGHRPRRPALAGLPIRGLPAGAVLASHLAVPVVAPRAAAAAAALAGGPLTAVPARLVRAVVGAAGVVLGLAAVGGVAGRRWLEDDRRWLEGGLRHSSTRQLWTTRRHWGRRRGRRRLGRRGGGHRRDGRWLRRGRDGRRRCLDVSRWRASRPGRGPAGPPGAPLGGGRGVLLTVAGGRGTISIS